MPIEAIVTTVDQPSGRELAVDIAAVRMWVTAELKRVDERHAIQVAGFDSTLALLERNVSIALSAQKELNATVAIASDKAIQKAEDAQKGVNERGNEFRQQLKDQNETMIPRTEAEVGFRNMGDRIDRSFKTVNETVLATEIINRKAQEDLRNDIIALREYNSRIEGRNQQQVKGSTDNRWLVGTVIGLAALGMSVLASGIFGAKPQPPTAVVQQPAPAPPINIIVPGGSGSQPAIGPGSPGTVTDTKSTTVPK